jgi:predicted nucleic acid-binding protein
LRFVDDNVFLYTLIGSPKRDFDTSKAVLKRVEEGEEAMTSLAVIQEVVDWLEYNGRKKEAGVFLAAVNSYTKMKKVSNMWRDFPRASAEAEKEGIDFVDALTLAVMRREKIIEVYSNDKDFDRILG